MGNNSSVEPVVADQELPQISYVTLDTVPKIYSVYVVLGNANGDESKGKVMRHYLVDQSEKASYCIRFNGGPNAGHTVFVSPADEELFITEEKRVTYTTKLIKFATHQVPTGVLFGIPSIIGYNCVVSLEKLYGEITEIAEKLGKTYDEIAELITIVPEAHIIMPWHVQQDKQNNSVGTTGTGIGPAYSEKALRIGYRVCDYYTNYNMEKFTELTTKLLSLTVPSFKDNTIVGVKIQSCKDIANKLEDGDVVVMEGAQGFHLDINHGNYPYVTSSDCTIGAACSYGFDLCNIHAVGVSKSYPTYVGSLQIEKEFSQDIKYSGHGELIRLFGKEYGVTTGRRRQCMPFNLDQEIISLRINQTEEWIISKSDVLVVYDRVLNKLANYIDLGTIPDQTPDSEEDKILIDYIKNTNNNIGLYKTLIDNGAFRLVHNGTCFKFHSWDLMKKYILDMVKAEHLPKLKHILWWDSPQSEIDLIRT